MRDGRHYFIFQTVVQACDYRHVTQTSIYLYCTGGPTILKTLIDVKPQNILDKKNA